MKITVRQLKQLIKEAIKEAGFTDDPKRTMFPGSTDARRLRSRTPTIHGIPGGGARTTRVEPPEGPAAPKKPYVSPSTIIRGSREDLLSQMRDYFETLEPGDKAYGPVQNMIKQLEKLEGEERS